MSNWEESKHPRDAEGKFTDKGQGTPAERKRLEEMGIQISNEPLVLPKQEYAELCSAIRTKFANKIPKSGGMLYKDSYYVYNYNKHEERIVCVDKYEIKGNEDLIAYMEKNYDRYRKNVDK